MTTRLTDRPRIAAYTSIVFSGAMFGFFYAWVCSTMWGLDRADPRTAIEAMQKMNDSVQNPVFFPAFFLTPVVLVVSGLIVRISCSGRACRWFFAAAALHVIGAMVLTLAVSVPMNDNLAATVIPPTAAEAKHVWQDYTGPWQRWNAVRAVVSAVTLILAVLGLAAIGRDEGRFAPPGALAGWRSDAAPACPAPTASHRTRR